MLLKDCIYIVTLRVSVTLHLQAGNMFLVFSVFHLFFPPKQKGAHLKAEERNVNHHDLLIVGTNFSIYTNIVSSTSQRNYNALYMNNKQTVLTIIFIRTRWDILSISFSDVCQVCGTIYDRVHCCAWFWWCLKSTQTWCAIPEQR